MNSRRCSCRLRTSKLGDYVAVRYGGIWPAAPASLPVPVARRNYGSEKSIHVPTVMTNELAFLLGAYMAEGHTTLSTWTVVITNSVPNVLKRVQRVLESEFGLQSRITSHGGRCPSVVTSSKRLVELMLKLGCGTRSSEKRVPQVIQQSTREHVLAFLQGVALDAYTTTRGLPRWAICLDTAAGISDLQDLVTRLGIANAQIAKWNKTYEKHYFELYAPGRSGQEPSRLAPFLEPDKFERALRYQAMAITGSDPNDVIPGARGQEICDSIPRGYGGRAGMGTGRQRFRSLCDKRTRHVTRASVLRAMEAGARVPDWLRRVATDDNIRFAPVVSVGEDILTRPLRPTAALL